MVKWGAVAVAILLLVAGLGWWTWSHSPLREIERSDAAVAKATNWHYHTVHLNRVDPSVPPETVDEDIFCPTFLHTTLSSLDRTGVPIVRDSIIYFGRSYNHLADAWVLAGGRQADINAQGSLPIFECLKGAMGSDDDSLPYKAITETGTVRQGGVSDAGGDSCRYYDVAVPTPQDPAEKEFRFSMCINEQDHLPRETRRTPPGATVEGVSTFTRWNAYTEPQLPPGFSK
jgi:hypothetical protein